MRVKFIIENENNQKFLSHSYEIEKLLEIDENHVLEQMEVCCCQFNESCNHCECEPEFENSKIIGKLLVFDKFDKNGKEIFENCVLKLSRFEFNGNEIDKEYTGIVEFDEINGFLLNLRNEDHDYINFINICDDSMEVIGNLIENPELLQSF